VGIALVLALFIPFLGLILAGFFAWQAHNEGRSGQRNLLLAVAVFAAVLIAFAPVGIWWRLLN
jgi:hypothetical protein